MINNIKNKLRNGFSKVALFPLGCGCFGVIVIILGIIAIPMALAKGSGEFTMSTAGSKNLEDWGGNNGGSAPESMKPAIPFSCAGKKYAFPVNGPYQKWPQGKNGFKDDFRHDHHDYSAIDIGAARGTPLVALTSGSVLLVRPHKACGQGFVIVGDDGFYYTYCHMSKVTVSNGEKVSAGKPVGEVGNTGTTGGFYHLHLQIDSPNPPRFHFPGGPDVSYYGSGKHKESPWRTLLAWKNGQCVNPGTGEPSK